MVPFGVLRMGGRDVRCLMQRGRLWGEAASLFHGLSGKGFGGWVAAQLGNFDELRASELAGLSRVARTAAPSANFGCRKPKQVQRGPSARGTPP